MGDLGVIGILMDLAKNPKNTPPPKKYPKMHKIAHFQGGGGFSAKFGVKLVENGVMGLQTSASTSFLLNKILFNALHYFFFFFIIKKKYICFYFYN